MSLMVIPDIGKVVWAEYAFRQASISEGWILALYKVDITLGDATVFSDFTKSNFTGYADVSIGRGTIGAAALVAHEAVCTLGTVPTFTCTGGTSQTAYGWFLYTSASFLCLAAQRFDTPRVMSAGTIEKLDPFALKLKAIT